ncbi:MAG: PfkB family carbohydrate kinase [Actinomycetota bacterium]|nr:PfkB family carbohydrate kinase [Actinomycetota bacterium]
MSQHKRALVVGEALVDIRIDKRAGAADAAEHAGGSPLNIAVGMARLGIDTTLAVQIGDDPRGDEIARHVAASGVELLRLAPQRATSTAKATIGPSGAATYDFDLTWDPDQLPDPAEFALIHVGSIGAALSPGADRVAELVADAARAGVPVSFDPNVRPGITPDLHDVRRRCELLTQGATVVKLSDEDAETLRPGTGAGQVARELAGLPRVRLAAVTLGGEGLLLDDGEDSVTVTAPSVEVADTIGAGDTVMAAMLAALLDHDLLPAPVGGRGDIGGGASRLVWLGELAVAAAAITCSRPGADPPWRSELSAIDSSPPD